MYYFEVKSLDKNKKTIEDIFQLFHLNTYKHNCCVGVSFPYQTNGNFVAIRFFSSMAENLKIILNLNQIYEYNVSISDIKPVPDNAVPFKIKKRPSSSLKKGCSNKIYRKVISKQVINDDGTISYKKTLGGLFDSFYLLMHSKSNQQKFSLCFYQEKLSNNEKQNQSNNNFTSYGFSKEGSYVYHF